MIERNPASVWTEMRPFHGDDARERAFAWQRGEATTVVDGVNYMCRGGTIVGNGTSVLASRQWSVYEPDVLTWSEKYECSKTVVEDANPNP